jgi:hypothetical protein
MTSAIAWLFRNGFTPAQSGTFAGKMTPQMARDFLEQAAQAMGLQPQEVGAPGRTPFVLTSPRAYLKLLGDIEITVTPDMELYGREADPLVAIAQLGSEPAPVRGILIKINVAGA